MSLKSKVEAVIYASEDPVTLPQLVGLLSDEVQVELDGIAALQADLPLRAAEESGDSSPVTPFTETTSSAPGTSHGIAAARTADSTAAKADDAVQGTSNGAAMAETTDDPDQQGAANSPAASADAPATPSTDAEKRQQRERTIREYLRAVVDGLIREYAEQDRGLEIREVAGGFRFGTKPEYHDAVRGFVKSLKPALRLSLQALETLAVVAYKQPVTAAEISEIRGVDSAGVLGGLLTRKLIQTAGRKQVIGRPMLYKTTREFLLRFGLRDIGELPSMEEFERMAGELAEQEDLPMEDADRIIEHANARGDAEHIHAANNEPNASPAAEAGPAGHPAGDPQEDTVDSDRNRGDSSATSEAQPARKEENQ